MNHQIKINSRVFKQIENGSKIYEIRLNDEKRQKIKIGDEIDLLELPLLKNILKVYVLDLVKADNFEELFTKINPVLAGWKEDDSLIKCAKDMSKYYSLEDQKKYGVVAIKIQLLPK